MTVPVDIKGLQQMSDADLYPPDPPAVMAPGDLGIEPPPAPPKPKRADGQRIDPTKLAEAVRNAGIADAERGQYRPDAFPGHVMHYDAGHTVGMMRQGKPWPPPNHSKVRDAR